MRTETQTATSSANVANSRSSAHTSGRAIFGHELASAKLIVIEGGSTDRWQALLQACHHEFQPESEIAAAHWCFRRCWPMETSLFDMKIAKLRENPQFEPQDYPSQHASTARDLGRNMRRGYGRAVENFTTSASAGITENFQTNPRIPANNPWQ